MHAAKNPTVYERAEASPKKYDSDADIPDDKIVEALTKLAVGVFASEDESDLH